MQEQITQLVEGLTTLRSQLDKTEDIEDRHARASADLASTNEKLKIVKAQLAEATAGLSSAQIENKKRHETEIYEKQGELRDLKARISEAQEQYNTLMANMKDRQAHYQTVLDGIDALKRRLDGKS